MAKDKWSPKDDDCYDDELDPEASFSRFTSWISTLWISTILCGALLFSLEWIKVRIGGLEDVTVLQPGSCDACHYLTMEVKLAAVFASATVLAIACRLSVLLTRSTSREGVFRLLGDLTALSLLILALLFPWMLNSTTLRLGHDKSSANATSAGTEPKCSLAVLPFPFKFATACLKGIVVILTGLVLSTGYVCRSRLKSLIFSPSKLARLVFQIKNSPEGYLQRIYPCIGKTVVGIFRRLFRIMALVYIVYILLDVTKLFSISRRRWFVLWKPDIFPETNTEFDRKEPAIDLEAAAFSKNHSIILVTIVCMWVGYVSRSGNHPRSETSVLPTMSNKNSHDTTDNHSISSYKRSVLKSKLFRPQRALLKLFSSEPARYPSIVLTTVIFFYSVCRRVEFALHPMLNRQSCFGQKHQICPREVTLGVIITLRNVMTQLLIVAFLYWGVRRSNTISGLIAFAGIAIWSLVFTSYVAIIEGLVGQFTEEGSSGFMIAPIGSLPESAEAKDRSVIGHSKDGRRVPLVLLVVGLAVMNYWKPPHKNSRA
ncbi:hypothetical protein K461DRAFT_278953 [Myriangium duriaei CBS 260.36]|uniref:Uncharacterized protein n=1 Tax=Myriangium duriaei CBS 260.36 TaxID=1168546 RepID=A0A9P4J3D1_9PEZI|nr:hypothetical protein K461DRAFT_278953 [Myriangium duriaei CBS 260.36]